MKKFLQKCLLILIAITMVASSMSHAALAADNQGDGSGNTGSEETEAPTTELNDDGTSPNTGTEEKELSDFYTGNDILYYDKRAGLCSGGGEVAGGATANIPSGYKAGKDILSAYAKHKSVYEKVSQETGVPPTIFAVLHYREASFGLQWPGNGQGLYQFYPETHYPRSGQLSQEEFLAQTRLVFTKKLVGKMRDVSGRMKQMGLNPPSYNIKDPKSVSAALQNEDFLKAVMFAFNGWASVYARQAEGLGFKNKPWEGSPYVMNLWDAPRNGTKATDKNKWGQIKVDNGPIEYPANDAVGSFTLYAALGGAVSGVSGCGNSTGGLQDVVRIAKEELAKKPVEYDKNVLKYSRNNQYAWCAAFVSWVFKEAGLPFKGGYPVDYYYPGVVNLSNYFKKSHIYFKPGEKDPQPGDIAFYIGKQTPDGGSTEHVNIVISYNKATNKMVTIGGNESNAVRQSTRLVKLGERSLAGFGRLK